MNLNNVRFNSKKFDKECYKKDEIQNRDIANYLLTKNHNIDKNCYQNNPEIRNQMLSEIKNTDDETKLFGIDRKELCDNFHTCDENTCKTQTFDKIDEKNNIIDNCDIPTVHSRYQINNLKEMGINRWENLKYDPQKYAIYEGRFNEHNINSRQIVKDQYKSIHDIKPKDHTNELKETDEFIVKKTNPVHITPFQDPEKNRFF